MSRDTWFAHPHVLVKGPRNRYFSTRMTLAFRRVSDGTLDVGVCFVSKRDNFCRKIGRAISTGRLNRDPINLGAISERPDTGDLIRRTLDSMRTMGMLPDTWTDVQASTSRTVLETYAENLPDVTPFG